MTTEFEPKHTPFPWARHDDGGRLPGVYERSGGFRYGPEANDWVWGAKGPGYGVVADVFSRGTRLRVIVMAAVRYDYALIATAAGPFHQFSQDYGTGHPSSANLEVARDIGKYINSFRWSGDRRKRPQ